MPQLRPTAARITGEFGKWYSGRSETGPLEGRLMTARAIVPDSTPGTPQFEAKPSDTAASTLPPPTARPHGQSLQGEPDVNPVTGRIRPISAEESDARQEELTKQLATIDAEDDTPDDVYAEFMRNLDEERRRQGRPPAFDGCY
jgi:hypothetical protein